MCYGIEDISWIFITSTITLTHGSYTFEKRGEILSRRVIHRLLLLSRTMLVDSFSCFLSFRKHKIIDYVLRQLISAEHSSKMVGS
jgi:hypothetical protein